MIIYTVQCSTKSPGASILAPSPAPRLKNPPEPPFVKGGAAGISADCGASTWLDPFDKTPTASDPRSGVSPTEWRSPAPHAGHELYQPTKSLRYEAHHTSG